jgi:hypothetical protein
MARNSSGTYSLAAGNPVSDGDTLTEALWNGTFNDLATAITDSLDRQGRGSMLAVLKCVDGSAGAPAFTFTSDLTMGMSRPAGGRLSLSAGGERIRMTSTRIDLYAANTYINGNLRTVTGELRTDQNLIFEGGGQAIIGHETTDGADDGQILIRSGGSTASGRGAYIRLYGNEAASNAADADLIPGDGGVLTLGQTGATNEIFGNTTLTGDLTLSGNITKTAAGNFILGFSTTDGADSGIVFLRSGGASSAARGAFIQLNGNEAASDPGRLLLGAGSTGSVVVNGDTTFSDDVTITGTLTASLAATSLTGTIAAARLTGTGYNFNNDAQIDGLAIGFRSLPVASGGSPENGKAWVIAANYTIDVASFAGFIYTIYNNSASVRTLTEGAGLTLRLAGTALTGNRTLEPRGIATVWFRTTSEAIISGAGVA